MTRRCPAPGTSSGASASDVLVVGAGVAGCATALALQRQGLSTVLLERSAGATARVGEHLSPDARPLLDRLNLWAAFLADRHVRSPGVRACWGDAGVYEREYILDPYGDGWNVDRERFDALLRGAVVAAGGTIVCNARTGTITAGDHGWSVESRIAGERRMFTAAFLVDATGRAAAVARRFGARTAVYDRLIGVMGWMKPSEDADVRDATLLIEAVAGGWWYATLLPDERLLAAFMTDPPICPTGAYNLASVWSVQMEGTRHIRARAAGFRLSGDVRAKFAGTSVCEPVAGRRWIAVGDAACAFDPLSSMGISKALQSGIAAAHVITRSLSGEPDVVEEYAAGVTRDFNEYLAARSVHYGRETRWPDEPFWRCRTTAEPQKPAVRA